MKLKASKIKAVETSDEEIRLIEEGAAKFGEALADRKSFHVEKDCSVLSAGRHSVRCDVCCPFYGGVGEQAECELAEKSSIIQLG